MLFTRTPPFPSASIPLDFEADSSLDWTSRHPTSCAGGRVAETPGQKAIPSRISQWASARYGAGGLPGIPNAGQARLVWKPSGGHPWRNSGGLPKSPGGTAQPLPALGGLRERWSPPPPRPVCTKRRKPKEGGVRTQAEISGRRARKTFRRPRVVPFGVSSCLFSRGRKSRPAERAPSKGRFLRTL